VNRECDVFAKVLCKLGWRSSITEDILMLSAEESGPLPPPKLKTLSRRCRRRGETAIILISCLILLVRIFIVAHLATSTKPFILRHRLPSDKLFDSNVDDAHCQRTKRAIEYAYTHVNALHIDPLNPIPHAPRYAAHPTEIRIMPFRLYPS